MSRQSKDTMTTEHADLYHRHQAVLPTWLSLYYDQPIEFVGGSGRHVTDAEGNTYLDFFGGILTTSTGYNVPEVVDAIRTQAGKMLHSSTLYLIRPMIELAEKIAALSTIDGAKVFFVSSGTEAVETALLMATTYRRSDQVLAVRNSYHGRTFGAVAVTGNRGWSPTSSSPLRVSFIASPDRLRSPFGSGTDEEFTNSCVADLRELLATTTAGDVACLIAEPIQGVGGFVVPPDGFYGAIKAVLDEFGILFIADEVQTGWGRTGEHFWGFESHQLTPDLFTFAKGLGNGLAIGGVVGRPEIIDCVNAGSISTFGGNPISCAGALANLDLILGRDLQHNALVMGGRLKAGLHAKLDDLAIVAELRGKGLMIGIELVTPGTLVANPAAAAQVLEAARVRGLLIGKGGLHGNVLRIAPALTVTADEIDAAIEIIAAAVHQVDAAATAAVSG